jgi:transcriptional regulator with XRE-family HTH domain
MNRDFLMIKDVAEGSGVSPATISDWRYTRSPSLNTFEAVLNNMGYRLKIVRQDDDE